MKLISPIVVTILLLSSSQAIGSNCSRILTILRHPIEALRPRPFDQEKFEQFKLQIAEEGLTRQSRLESAEEVLAFAELAVNRQHADGLVNLNQLLTAEQSSLSRSDRVRRNLLVRFAQRATSKSRRRLQLDWPPFRWEISNRLNARLLRRMTNLFYELNILNGVGRSGRRTLQERYGDETIHPLSLQRIVKGSARRNFEDFATEIGFVDHSNPGRLASFFQRYQNILAVSGSVSVQATYAFVLFKFFGPTWWMLFPVSIPRVNLLKKLDIEADFRSAYLDGGLNHALDVVHNRIERIVEERGGVNLSRANRRAIMQSASNRARWLHGTLVSGLLAILVVEIAPVLANGIGFANVTTEATAAAQADMSNEEIKALLDDVWWESHVAFHGEPSEESIEFAYELTHGMPGKTADQIIQESFEEIDRSDDPVFIRAFLREYYWTTYVRRDEDLRVDYD